MAVIAPLLGLLLVYWRRHSRSERGPRWPSLESLSAECLWEPTGNPDDRRAGVAIFFGMRTHLQEPCGAGIDFQIDFVQMPATHAGVTISVVRLLYKMHEAALHGLANMILDTIGRTFRRRNAPVVKLH
jgi:hypothetical protein